MEEGVVNCAAYEWRTLSRPSCPIIGFSKRDNDERQTKERKRGPDRPFKVGKALRPRLVSPGKKAGTPP